MIIAFLLTLLLGGILTRVLAETSPRRPIERESDMPGSYLLIQGNSLLPISPPFNGNPEIWEIYEKYPNLAETLICLWWEESKYGTDKVGDNGLAIGDFQIQIWQHPSISYTCAMDFKCSLDWTVKQIKNGYGYWWTPIKNKMCPFP